MTIFATRLRQLRKANNVTQAQLAEAIGITDRACRRYESGENEPTLSILKAIADFFDVDMDFLAGRKNYYHKSDGQIATLQSEVLNLDMDEFKKQMRKEIRENKKKTKKNKTS